MANKKMANKNQAQHIAPETAPSQDSVDQIRDILFGQHLREFQQRFASLEAQMQDKITELGQAIDQLNTHISQRLDSLDKSLKQEQQETANALAEEIQQLDKQLNRKITETEADLQQQLDSEVSRLDDRKTDRNELAKWLNELAGKLAD